MKDDGKLSCGESVPSCGEAGCQEPAVVCTGHWLQVVVENEQLWNRVKTLEKALGIGAADGIGE